MSEVTRILDSIAQGDREAAEKLLPLVYEELRRLAAHKMTGEAPGHTLQPTELVHEAWMRLTGGKEPRWDNRAHFFGAAAEAMRRILVGRARKRTAWKRGGGAERVSLDEMEIPMVVVDGPVPGLVPVEISAERVQLMGMRTAKVSRRHLAPRLRAVGSVTANERAVAIVTARPSGWVEEVRIALAGQRVRKGEVLLTDRPGFGIELDPAKVEKQVRVEA